MMLHEPNGAKSKRSRGAIDRRRRCRISFATSDVSGIVAYTRLHGKDTELGTNSRLDRGDRIRRSIRNRPRRAPSTTRAPSRSTSSAKRAKNWPMPSRG